MDINLINLSVPGGGHAEAGISAISWALPTSILSKIKPLIRVLRRLFNLKIFLKQCFQISLAFNLILNI